MSQHFIENIKIQNFKCFENLEINEFRRVNVFGGKNNVGKTALLEAIELLVKSHSPASLAHHTYSLLKKRQQTKSNIELDLFREPYSEFSIRHDFRVIGVKDGFNILLDSVVGIGFVVDDESLIVSFSDFVQDIVQSSLKKKTKMGLGIFVKSSKIDDYDISVLYGSVLELEKESFLNESLNIFDQSIISLKIVPTEDEVVPKFKIKGRDSLVPLSEMGDGISRYVTILCAIWASQNGFLFIDEIENGIHYSNYKKLWQLIFMASEQANCQVFVTSHSKECITAFNEVQQERTDNAGNYFELYKSEKKQRIVAAVRDAEQLQYALTHGEAIRGE